MRLVRTAIPKSQPARTLVACADCQSDCQSDCLARSASEAQSLECRPGRALRLKEIYGQGTKGKEGNRTRSQHLAQRGRWVWLGAGGAGSLRLHRQGEHSEEPEGEHGEENT